MTHLIYVADPMCSWCYGFGPELQALLDAVPGSRLDLVLGGLRAYNQQVLDDTTRTTILSHWKHVEERSGLPFGGDAMSQPGFIYDTEPACRAVVAARTLVDEVSSAAVLNVFHAIQHAFYAEGKDVTDIGVLSEIAVTALNAVEGADSYDAISFHETMLSPMTMSDARQDFEQSQRWGIRGFPALLLVHQDALHMIASGYTTRDELIATLKQVQQT